MKTIAFFNNKGGVGKTTLLYHVAWMFSEMGISVAAVDLDPQANLTSMFLSEERLDDLWEGPDRGQTIVASLSPLLQEGTGDIQPPRLQKINSRLALVPGDLGLANMEDELSAQWTNAMDGQPKAFRETTAFHRVIGSAAELCRAEIALLDVGPNLGALNRCALIAADYIAVPLVPDLFSLQGLRNLGPTLRKWRKGWKQRMDEAPESMTGLPQGRMAPAGYVVVQHAVRQSRPVKAYLRWADKIPAEYREAMGEPQADGLNLDSDPHCLAQLKHYRSLMPMAMEASKPIFHLKPADGAIGAHAAAVAECGKDFRRLATRLATATGIEIPNGRGVVESIQTA